MKWCLVSLIFFCAGLVKAQNTTDLVKKHLEAIGGEEKWNTVKSFLIEGRRISEGLEVEEKKLVVLHKSLRIDYKFIARDPAFENKKYFILVHSGQGWRYLPDNNRDTIEKLLPADIAWYKLQMEFDDPFLNAAKRNIKIDYLNNESILDREYYKFSVHYPDDRREYVFIDMKTFLVRKRVISGPDSDQEYTYEDYETLENGLVIPHTIGSLVDDFKVTVFKVNVAVDDATFRIK